MYMFSRTIIIVALVLLTFQCFAAAPVATVSSTESIVVSGISVPTSRVMSWPVNANDEIATQAAPAMVRFADGTVMTLQRNSRMRLEQRPSGVEVKMLAGSAMYSVQSRSTISLGPAVAAVRASTNTSVNGPARGTLSTSSNEALATALAYRMPAQAPSQGVVFAPTAISTSQFGPAAGATRQAVTSPGGQYVTLPSGVVLEVIPVPNSPGQYTVSRVLIPVTVNGLPTYATAPNSTLLGAGMVVLNQGTAQQQVTVFSGATPLTPAQLSTAFAAAGQDAVNNAPGATQRPTGPITVDPVSGPAT
jgi:hypothetical protein